MARFLHVWLNGNRVGELQQDDDGQLRFRYLQEWLSQAEAAPLSVSLPLQKEAFPQKQARPFFAGLLPEETNRDLIAKMFGVSKNNDFALLDRIGGECAGAVSLLPVDATPAVSGPPSYHYFDEEELSKMFFELPKRPLMAGETGLRLSLAGAQSKIAVARLGDAYALPIDNAPSTHILKPSSPHFVGLVENECFCMKLAAAVGLTVADGDEDWRRTRTRADPCQKLVEICRGGRSGGSRRAAATPLARRTNTGSSWSGGFYVRESDERSQNCPHQLRADFEIVELPKPTGRQRFQFLPGQGVSVSATLSVSASSKRKSSFPDFASDSILAFHAFARRLSHQADSFQNSDSGSWLMADSISATELMREK